MKERTALLLLTLLSMGLIVWGLWLIYRPAALLGAGLLIWIDLHTGKRA